MYVMDVHKMNALPYSELLGTQETFPMRVTNTFQKSELYYNQPRNFIVIDIF
jgi:hypothetical protein